MHRKEVLPIVLLVVIGVSAMVYVYIYTDTMTCPYKTFESCLEKNRGKCGTMDSLESTMCACDVCYKCKDYKDDQGEIFATSICPLFTKTPHTNPRNISEMNDSDRTKLLETVTDAKNMLAVYKE